MAINKIEIYQNNTKTINCVVTGLSLTGYTPTLTVKSNTLSTAVLSKTGVVQDPSTATFYISSTDSSLAVGDYVYDIVVSADASIYTVTKDAFIILDGVKF